jgi:hypothetical protein
MRTPGNRGEDSRDVGLVVVSHDAEIIRQEAGDVTGPVQDAEDVNLFVIKFLKYNISGKSRDRKVADAGEDGRVRVIRSADPRQLGEPLECSLGGVEETQRGARIVLADELGVMLQVEEGTGMSDNPSAHSWSRSSGLRSRTPCLKADHSAEVITVAGL